MVHETPLAGMKSEIKFDLTPFEKGSEGAFQVLEGAAKPLSAEEQKRATLMENFRASIELVRARAAVEAVKPPGLINNAAGFSIYAKTLNTLVSREGCFKSTMLNVVAASLLKKPDYTGYHFLGFSLDSSVEKFRILILDTEQDENYSVVKRMQSITRMAGYELSEIPANLEILPLVRYTLAEKLEALREMIPAIRQTDKDSHLIVICDIITDFLKDINDSKDSPEITSHLNKLANDFDCTFLLTIHEAKTSNGARGHIGSELLIKSRCVMRISEMKIKPTEEGNIDPVYRLSVAKNSFGRKGMELYFSYDCKTGNLRYSSTNEKELMILPMTHSEIMERLIEKFGMDKAFTVRIPGKNKVRPELVEIYGKDKDNTIRQYLRELSRKSPVKVSGRHYEVSLVIRATEKPLQYIIVDSNDPGSLL